MTLRAYRNRYGRFYIRAKLLDDEPWLARCILSRCVIVKAEFLYAHDAIEYEASSMEFDEVPLGTIMPTYDVVIDEETGISFEKTDKRYK